ncbi:MAG: eukaryotic-like serine/threonine-protein kinase [Actinomycetota bacterium]|jgi:serine/threonine-protein kinase|nr:eukaryotic-like serine/threonine-protein kinase [Actinomycetota bacterium]
MSDRGPQVFNGRYELVRRVARGGMAEVYLAHDQLLDRPVALKILFPELSVDRSFVERFRREAQAAANLSHPNIVSIYDWGEEEGTYFIVMEYIDGRTLANVIQTEGPLLADRAAAIGADVAAALAFAHRNGVIHRDVKPGNVLIDTVGNVKVADFGIARAANTTENLTQTGAVMGTATYFSPEQAQGLSIDPRSDVYSLGVVLYEMVTGQPPFKGDNPVAVAYKHVGEEPPAPRSLQPNIPAPFEAVVMTAMAKDPGMRYSSAEDLRADLLRFRGGRGVLATPAPAQQATQAVPVTTLQPAASATRAVPAADVYEEPHRRTGAYVVLLFVLLGLLGLILFLVGRTLGVGGSSTKQTTVPTVTSKTDTEAKSILTSAGFKVKELQEANDADAGIVFDQSPSGGAKAKSGSSVTIKVSAGAAPIKVPDVVGQTVNDASDTLRGVGFNVQVNEQPDDTKPAGEVLAQDPKANTDAAKGSTITLTVSSGKAKVVVPDESGKDATEAANDLGAKKLKTKTTHEASSTVADGSVIRTDPAAGTAVDEGSTVTLVVSSGPEQVTVPDVMGMTQTQATQTLQNAGFHVVSQDQFTTHSSENGRVLDQSPNAGTKADKGSTVTITVGRSPAGSTTSTTA